MISTLKNIKIPYPTEGTIRTAQIDDPVAPQDSAELLMNMNADQVGSVKTRLGVEKYADQLSKFIVENSESVEFYSPLATFFSSVKVDATHILVFWSGASHQGYAQVMQISDTSGFIPIGTALNFDLSVTYGHCAIQVDSTHFMNIWAAAGEANCQIFTIDGSYNVTAFGGFPHVFDSGTSCTDFTVSQVTSTEFIIFYGSTGGAGYTVILVVDLSTWAIGNPASPAQFATLGLQNSCASLGSNIFINFWSDGKSQCFEVNTTTLTITPLSVPYVYDTGSQFNSCVPLGDGKHFINFWQGSRGAGTHGIASIFAVDMTFAITEPGTYTYFTTFTSGSGLFNSAVSLGDGIHFVNFWNEGEVHDATQVFNVDPFSFDVTTIGSPYIFEDSSISSYNSAVVLSPSLITNVWHFSDDTGHGALFNIDTNGLYPIKNFGTLNNFIIPAGFSRISEIGAGGTFSEEDSSNMKSVRIGDNYILAIWTSANGNGKMQVLKFNEELISLVPVGSPYTFLASVIFTETFGCAKIDDNHFIVTWADTSGHAVAQVFTVFFTGAISPAAGSTTFDSGSSSLGDFNLSIVDSNHVIVFYNDNGLSEGYSVILEINLGTWAVTVPHVRLMFSSLAFSDFSSAVIGDGIHFICSWNPGKMQTFSVNTGTWAISAIGSPLTFDPSFAEFNQLISLGDGMHFINFWQGGILSGNKGVVQTFYVDPSTFAVSSIGTTISFAEFTAGSGLYLSAVSTGDGQHFVCFWEQANFDGSAFYGYDQIFYVDPSTFFVTPISVASSYGQVSIQSYNSAVTLTPSRVSNVWRSVDMTGFGANFRLDGLPIFHNLLYAHVDENVENWDGTSWTVRRSDLEVTEGRARFVQYLNRIWMCNGNATIGDPIMTSDGGDFDTTLVPLGFPPVDYISAGFEGRVWGADALYGVIYYTDIVQFVPPDFYTLTYNPQVNFISQFSPQDGETITGLFEVPRALLVFTENSIYRIYGATSIDAYAAYNVGTYSQESIIRAKSGIFFHHSSGFYQFDYGGQPVEISRRIIDFIQAIPREYYPDITGVWDGFDCVEWSIGNITIDNVTYPNCVARFTISTQVWAIYSYVDNVITAMIRFDDKETLPHLMGTAGGKTGAMDTGYDDFGVPFFFEYIDRWRGYSDMYADVKQISGMNVYNKNAAGANITFQNQDAVGNAWEDFDTIEDSNNSLFPNSDTSDFNAGRFRIAGTTRGAPITIHGIEILSITIKGYDKN